MIYEALKGPANRFISNQDKLNETRQMLKDELKFRRMLVEESRDSIVIVDEQGGVYESNSRFARLLGYTLDEIYTLHVWDWDALLSKEQILTLLKDVNHSGQHFETLHRCKDGTLMDMELSNNSTVYRGKKLTFCICRDITKRKNEEREREEMIAKLQASLAEIKTLQGILPLCSFCKKIRDDKGYWEQVDTYIEKHSGADISHSICPECLKKNYPEEYDYLQSQKQC